MSPDPMSDSWLCRARSVGDGVPARLIVPSKLLRCGFALLALCHFAACGLTCGGPDGDAGDAGAPTQAEGLTVLKLREPGANRYAEDLPMVDFDVQVEAVLRERVGLDVDYDPCLARAADEYGAYVVPLADGGSRKVPTKVQEAVLHNAGCTDGWVSVHLYFTNEASDAGFFDHLRQVFAGLDDAETTHIGAARVAGRAQFRWTYVLFRAERNVAFEPVPRVFEPGDTLTIKGVVLRDLDDPDVLLLEPGGEVQGLDVELLPGGRFSAVKNLGTAVGEYWIEVLATDERGPRVAALFPVYVGASQPSRIELEPLPNETDIVTTRDAERLMFKLINDDRKTFGLSPLAWNEDVAAIARAHSLDMLENSFFAHVSPRAGDLAKRFDTAGFPARRMAENIARNSSVYQAELGLMQSLGHRDNILDRKSTDVGVGVVMGTDEYGNRFLVLTQNFATPQRRLSGAEARDEVEGRLQRRRKRRRLNALARDDDLQSVAARFCRYADTDDGGYTADELTQRITAALKERNFRVSAFYVQTHTVLDPEDVQIPSATDDQAVVRMGIGVYPDRQSSGRVRWRTLIILAEL